MTHSPDDLYRAIGRVVYEWALLEDLVDALVFDLTAICSRRFYEDDDIQAPYILMSSNLDLRANISTAKALALHIEEDVPDLFSRLEPVLNRIENEIRNERNRFVHDRWTLWGDKIVRAKAGTKISREPATGHPKLDIGSVKEFAQMSDVEAVADHIFAQNILIQKVREELQEAYRQKYPVEE